MAIWAFLRNFAPFNPHPMSLLQVKSYPRHLRYIFFIDSTSSYSFVLNLVKENLRLWGGRYNPIVPVTDGVISPSYLDLIKHYDPDIIYYSTSIDPELIKQLRLFSPREYIGMNPPHVRIDGVNALSLLSAIDNKGPVLAPHQLAQADSPLLNYFCINFGIRKYGWDGDNQLVGTREQILVTSQELTKLHGTLQTRNPVIQSQLAGHLSHTPILRNTKDAPANAFEIVIAKDTSSFADLLYFWNRHLYETFRIFYVTVEELSFLRLDTNFPFFLDRLTPGGIVTIVSLSIPENEIQNVLDAGFGKVPFHREFKIKKVDSFPYSVETTLGARTPLMGRPIVQTLNADETLLFIPPFPYASVKIQPQQWAVDLQLMQLGAGGQSEWLFPFTTDTGGILRNCDGRVNLNRQLSYFADSTAVHEQQLRLEMSTFNERLHQLISHPALDGSRQNTKYVHIGPHDPSSRLAAFIDLFGGNFDTIDEYFSDRFWSDLFDDLCQSGEAAGDAISVTALSERCRALMEKEGIVFGQWPATPFNDKNLRWGITDMMTQLTRLTVLIPGHSLKCPRCATIAWYPLEQVTVKVRCSGCLVDFSLPIDPPFAYRLNALVQKNIFQSKPQRDGNLTIIRTLARLSKETHKDFHFSPQLNLHVDLRSGKPETDIDIIALQDGIFSIGEAKYDSSEFSSNGHKCLHSLIDVASSIRPDRVTLSCTTDTNQRLEKAKKFLEHHFQKIPYPPQVIAFQLHEPDYFNFQGASKYFRH
jgi:hypothetical protein